MKASVKCVNVKNGYSGKLVNQQMIVWLLSRTRINAVCQVKKLKNKNLIYDVKQFFSCCFNKCFIT